MINKCPYRFFGTRLRPAVARLLEHTSSVSWISCLVWGCLLIRFRLQCQPWEVQPKMDHQFLRKHLRSLLSKVIGLVYYHHGYGHGGGHGSRSFIAYSHNSDNLMPIPCAQWQPRWHMAPLPSPGNMKRSAGAPNINQPYSGNGRSMPPMPQFLDEKLATSSAGAAGGWAPVGVLPPMAPCASRSSMHQPWMEAHCMDQLMADGGSMMVK